MILGRDGSWMTPFERFLKKIHYMMNSGCHGSQGDTISSSLQKPMVKLKKVDP